MLLVVMVAFVLVFSQCCSYPLGVLDLFHVCS
jgi:hypothetical protein